MQKKFCNHRLNRCRPSFYRLTISTPAAISWRVTLQPPEINLVFAWTWVLAGFLSGLAMGLFFDREDWLGGYGSLKRRLYRLAHICFFGLGAINLMFYFTARYVLQPSPLQSVAAWGF